MTDTEHRLSKLEDNYHTIDTRQQTFETFMRAYIDGNEKRMERLETRMDRIESKLDNLLIAGGIGIATIVVAIALK